MAVQYVVYFRFLDNRVNGWVRIKDDTYVSPSLPGGGTIRTSDNVAWSRLLDGDTGA